MKVTNVCFGYPTRPVLKHISFTAGPTEFLVIAGINGAGKSTLLDILAGLRQPSEGTVEIEGRLLQTFPARERAKIIGHLPQGAKQDLPFTVEQVVLMGRYAYADRWFESPEDRAIAEQAMRTMDCLAFRARLYATLSGGEQQRVLLAACIAQHPRILLFDEPSTYLDIHQQLQCFAILADLASKGALCIAVTHDLNLALTYATRILILDKGELAADFPTAEALNTSAWLHWLSPQLHLSQTPEGRPWVRYT